MTPRYPMRALALTAIGLACAPRETGNERADHPTPTPTPTAPPAAGEDTPAHQTATKHRLDPAKAPGVRPERPRFRWSHAQACPAELPLGCDIVEQGSACGPFSAHGFPAISADGASIALVTWSGAHEVGNFSFSLVTHDREGHEVGTRPLFAAQPDLAPEDCDAEARRAEQQVTEASVELSKTEWRSLAPAPLDLRAPGLQDSTRGAFSDDVDSWIADQDIARRPVQAEYAKGRLTFRIPGGAALESHAVSIPDPNPYAECPLALRAMWWAPDSAVVVAEITVQEPSHLCGEPEHLRTIAVRPSTIAAIRARPIGAYTALLDGLTTQRQRR